ncbi:outer membrane protein assembly factor BamB [Haloactinopolyspora alba]|uniref:Outer membrane protein assembly factor BamB n=1 Tax=Haloactinopolyspora alba TaxID=648780 RepID=A0A2P8DZR9_9ACTN|nr:PQQ-binding-like beta-propeller repeat protein [Haloactinopolyspora alba]PSL02723.1 outer membrane protein assembly factor BamB [Haloactinopolyspora alba]
MAKPAHGLFSLTAAAALAVATMGAAPPVTAQSSTDGPVTDLGEPVQKTQVLSSATGESPDGVPLGYYVVSGNPTTNAEFTVMNLRTEELVLQTRVPHGHSSQRTMGKSPVDGTIYFATSDEPHLYSYTPGDTDVNYIGPGPEGQRVWSMDVGHDGTVWFGTYPGGRLYSLDPDTGEMTDHGQAAEGEQYIKSIEPAGDTVYVGTQANAKLLEYDRSGGQFTEITMPEGHSASNINALNLRKNLLFVGTDETYVRDVQTGEWVDSMPRGGSRVSPIAPNDPDAVYLRVAGEVTRYDLSTGEKTGTGWAPNATAESWGWIDRDGTGPWLALTYWRQGRTYTKNFATGEGTYQVPDLLGAGAPIISLGTGPQGNIYTGAYLSPPGMGRYNPDKDGFELLRGTSQVEGYGTFGDELVFGRYPQGALYHYDPSQPWDKGTNPEARLPIGDEQSRPQAFVDISDTVPGTVAVASVPDGGRHGGAITLWQPDEGTLEVFRHVVENQTPVSLVQKDGILYGGTSIEGGYGIDPVTENGRLFGWDPTTGETLWELAPVPGEPTVSGLALDGDGDLWGIAGSSTVFEFDLETRETIRTIEIDADAGADRYGDDHRLLFDNGRLFGSTANRLFVLDQVTGEVTTLHGGDVEQPADRVHELARDRNGDLYFVGAATRLMRYDLPDDTTAPEVSADVRAGDSGARAAVVKLSADDAADGEPTIHVRVDGGEWSEYDRPVVLRQGQTLEYRAIDDAWNSTPVRTYTFTD